MTNIRTDWSRDEIAALFDLPFTELLFQAATVHREFHPPEQVQLCTLLSIKTGGCPEDCAYCPQSVHYDTGVEAGKLLDAAAVSEAAQAAREEGASRFCMGAAWRAPKDRDIEKVAELVRVVKSHGLEACCTLGMLSNTQARRMWAGSAASAASAWVSRWLGMRATAASSRFEAFSSGSCSERASHATKAGQVGGSVAAG